jgi:hypothetical protein
MHENILATAARLSDDALLARLKSLANRERDATVERGPADLFSTGAATRHGHVARDHGCSSRSARRAADRALRPIGTRRGFAKVSGHFRAS